MYLLIGCGRIFFKVTFHFLWFFLSLFFLSEFNFYFPVLYFIKCIFIIRSIFKHSENVIKINLVTSTLVIHAVRVSYIERHQLTEFMSISSYNIQFSLTFSRLSDHIPNMNRCNNHFIVGN